MRRIALLVLSAASVTVGACQSTSAPSDAAGPAAKPAVPVPAGGPAAPAATFAGGDGLSMAQAVVVAAPDESAGVRAEYTWLRLHYPGYKRTSQALVREGKRSYDVLDIELPGGGKFKAYFDITDFFGKPG